MLSTTILGVDLSVMPSGSSQMSAMKRIVSVELTLMSSKLGDSAVDNEFGAKDEARFVACKEENGPGDVIGVADASNGGTCGEVVSYCSGLQCRASSGLQWRVNTSGRHRIHSNVTVELNRPGMSGDLPV